MRQWDENHPYHKVSGGAYEYFNGMSMPDLIKDIVKVDDYTVKFVLNRPEAPMIANLAMDFASILSAEYADKMMEAGTPEQIDLQPVGTGPFQLIAYQKDAVIRYKAHPDYWKGKIGRAHVELQSLMRTSYAVFCFEKKKLTQKNIN